MKKVFFFLLSVFLLYGCPDDDASDVVDEDSTTTEECIVGASCDDGDPDTVNDVFNDNCLCVGEPDAQGLVPVFGSYTDPRDGKVYQTVTIGDKEWFAENLDYRGLDTTIYGNIQCYENDPAYCDIYGVLYTHVAIGVAAPPGWRIPSLEEVQELYDLIVNATGDTDVGHHMRVTGTEYWLPPNEGATNASGFSALPAGSFYSSDFLDLGRTAYFWTSTPYPNSTTYYYFIVRGHGQTFQYGPNHNKKLSSIRPIRD